MLTIVAMTGAVSVLLVSVWAPVKVTTVESMLIVLAVEPSKVVPESNCNPVPTVKAAVVLAVIVPEAPRATVTPLYVTEELTSDELPMFVRLLSGPLIVLLVSVSLLESVAKVPETGKVTLVSAVTAKVVLNAPEVTRLPPSVMVLPALLMPVPPLAPFKMPPRVTAPVVPVAGVKPVAPALKEVTPPVSENWRQEPEA